MSIVFINPAGETFTPTQSGAVATWIWEMCHAAQKDSVEPLVISKTYGVEPYPWPRTILIPYPDVRPFRGAGRLFHIQQKITGWAHIRQKAYLVQVVRAIRKEGAESMPMVLNNDVEAAVFLRHYFPKAFILHNAHNNNKSSERFRRRFVESVDVATAVSDYVKTWNEKYFGFSAGGIRTLYNGVDCDRFRLEAMARTGPCVINFLGRICSDKGTDLMLQACLQLVARTKAFSVQILGSSHWERLEENEYIRHIRELIEKVRQSGIEVRWPGFVSRWDLPDELRKAHINVTPSRWDEPCALTILEGMACGLAVVASRTGGTPEIVGDAGFLFERDSVEELADHLYNLVTNEPLRLEYARRGRKSAEEFTWDRTWAQLRSLLG